MSLPRLQGWNGERLLVAPVLVPASGRGKVR